MLAVGAATLVNSAWNRKKFRKRATAPANKQNEDTVDAVFVEPLVIEEDEDNGEEISEYTEGT